MRNFSRILGELALGALLTITLMALPVIANAQYNQTILHTFYGQPDGAQPGPVLFNSNGKVYGSTAQGGLNDCTGDNGCGIAYQLVGFNETIIHYFTGGPSDGWYPTGLFATDSHGDLFGATTYGGSKGGQLGGGTVVEFLRVTTNWQELILHDFGGSGDGSQPIGDPIRDPLGNLYGVTSFGGNAGGGILYKLAAPSYDETVLYNFPRNTTPNGGLIFGANGVIYGTTQGGGTNGHGSIYSLTQSGVYTTLYSFTGGSDGGVPVAGVFIDSNGNLDGTAASGGSGSGTAYQLTPPPSLQFTVLHTFTGGSGGSLPFGVFVQDASGALYGTTGDGGGNDGCNGFGCGSVWKLSGGSFSILYSFNGADGSNPQGLVLQPGEQICGNTYGAGSGAWGNVYCLQPALDQLVNEL